MPLIKCPDCKNDLSDKASFCPKCGLQIFTETNKINTETKLELIEYFKSQNIITVQSDEKKLKDFKDDTDYRIKFWGNILVWFVTLISILGYSSLDSFKNKLNTYIEEKSKDINKNFERISSEIELRAEKEFSKIEIQNIVNKTAKNYTEYEIKLHVSKKVDEVIVPFKNEITDITSKSNTNLQNIEKILFEANAKVEKLESTILEASNEINRHKELIQLVYLSEEAQCGSKKSLEKLFSFTNITNEIGLIALKLYDKVIKDLDSYHQSLDLLNLNYKSGEVLVSFDTLPLDQMYFRMTKMSETKIHQCMQHIKKRPKEEIFKIANEVFQTSDSSFICAAFGGVLSELYEEQHKNRISHLDFEFWTKYTKLELNKIERNKQKMELIIKHFQSLIIKAINMPINLIKITYFEIFQKLNVSF